MATGTPRIPRVGVAWTGVVAPTGGLGSGWACIFGLGRVSGWQDRSGRAGPSRTLQRVRHAGVAPPEPDTPAPDEARLLASGALLQQVAQASGLIVLLAIVTVLARRLTVAELG